MKTPETIREENLAFLNEHGFVPATWMPLPPTVGKPSEEAGYSGGVLRPAREIAERFLCHCAVFAWGSAPEEFEQPISNFIAVNSLKAQMTPEEIGIVDMPKLSAREQFGNTVGWRLENMWSLAWLLGLLEQPSAIIGQLPNEVTQEMLALVLPEFDLTTDVLLARGEPAPVEAVIEAEDLFYLAHNAVRSGQLGKADAVPVGFDPIGDGGAIHERRHSLTWSLSPGTSWNDTDLST